MRAPRAAEDIAVVLTETAPRVGGAADVGARGLDAGAEEIDAVEGRERLEFGHCGRCNGGGDMR